MTSENDGTMPDTTATAQSPLDAFVSLFGADDGAETTAQSPAGPDFLTEDERRFFAYMAEQRFRTVSEMDPEKREAARARWQEVALWFVPSWNPEQRTTA